MSTLIHKCSTSEIRTRVNKPFMNHTVNQAIKRVNCISYHTEKFTAINESVELSVRSVYPFQ